MNNERIIKAIKKKWWLIVIVVLVSTGSTILYNINTSKSLYQASTSMYVMTTANGQKTLITTDNLEVSQQIIKDYSQLIKSEKITAAIEARLGLNETMRSVVTMDIMKGTNILVLSATDEDPARAKAVANACAQVLKENILGINTQTSLVVIDEATLPGSAIPNNNAVKVILSFFLSVVAICAIIILLEFFDNTVHTVEEVEKELGYSVIGIIPRMNIK